MPLTIPCRPDLTFYDMRVVLDGTTYTLEFRWNTREESWYMSILTQDEEPILMSIKVVPTFPLAQRSQDPRRPPGFFIAVDSSGQGIAPGVADLGDRVVLLYYSADGS